MRRHLCLLLRLLRTPSRLPWTGLQLVLLESGNPATRGTVSTFLGMRRLCGDPTSTWILQPRAARRVLPTVQTVAMGVAARCSGTMARPNSGAAARAGAMLGSSVPQRLASASRMIFTSTNVANAGSSTSPTSACRSPQVRSSQLPLNPMQPCLVHGGLPCRSARSRLLCFSALFISRADPKRSTGSTRSLSQDQRCRKRWSTRREISGRGASPRRCGRQRSRPRGYRGNRASSLPRALPRGRPCACPGGKWPSARSTGHADCRVNAC